MSPGSPSPDWAEVDALFQRALDVPSSERGRFLAAAGDGPLRSAVEELLVLAEEWEDLLETPVELAGDISWGKLLDSLKTQADFPESSAMQDRTGERLGPYRLLRQIGRGGMATVYLAERADGQWEQQVALKVIRRGLDTDDTIRRFLGERQILSSLQHPNIARLLGGGSTEDDLPFLVLEYVDGVPITDWVSREALSLADRIRLFLQVVDAVAYAHGRLVVHRDLKPSNVYVARDGQVKLLDFGVAKLLEPERHPHHPVTRHGPAPLTPLYASPEQLRGEQVSVASDVFQLGALLFRILTGERPFQDSDVRARLRGTIQPVPRPSAMVTDAALARSLRGDVDTIVSKALEFTPSDRYPSAERLAADLRSHLQRRPISARPASVRVRLTKFSRRNPWFWPVAGALTVGLAAYVGTVVRYSSQLEVQRAEAIAEADRAEAIRGFMMSQFGAADPYSDEPVSPDVTMVDAMLLSAEAARRDLADQPLLQAEMLSAVAQVFTNLSLYGEARELLDEAMEIRRTLGADGGLEQVGDLGLLGWTLGEEGMRDSARVLLTKRLALERELSGDADPRTADALERLGWHWFVDGGYGQSVQWYEEAVAIRRAAEPRDLAALSASLAALADGYRAMDRWMDAKAVATEAYETARTEFGEEHPVTAGNKGHLAQVVHGMGDLDHAITLYREALPVLERTLGSMHASTLSNWNNLGIVLDQAGDLSGAEEVHRRILAIRRERHETEEHHEVAASLQNLAGLLVRQGRYPEADSLARESERIFRLVHGPLHYTVGFALITQAESALQRERGTQAERLIRPAIDILEPQFGRAFPTAAATCRLGRALGLQDRTPEAERMIADALSQMDGAAGVPRREVELCRGALRTVGGAG